MTTVKTNAETNNYFARARYSARRVSPARVLAFSLLLLAGAGLLSADELSDWDHIMLEATLTAPATPAPVSTRSTAIVQAAVFDAVNGIDPHYTPIFVAQWSATGLQARGRGPSRVRYFAPVVSGAIRHAGPTALGIASEYF